MSEAIVDYEVCRRRLFDSPYDPVLREQILVIGDRLEMDGNILGASIALSEALSTETNRERRTVLAAELGELLCRNADELLGPFAPYSGYERVLNLDWRAGAVHKALIDLRHLGTFESIQDSSLLDIVLNAPILRTARHLWVRTRGKGDDEDLLNVVSDNAEDLRELEVVIVGQDPRPHQIRSRFFLRSTSATTGHCFSQADYGLDPLWCHSLDARRRYDA